MSKDLRIPKRVTSLYYKNILKVDVHKIRVCQVFIHELLVASQQFSRRSPIKRDLPPASKCNRKICSKMITSIIRYHTAIYYIMSITRDRFRPYCCIILFCIAFFLHPMANLFFSMFIIECFLHPPDETQ